MNFIDITNICDYAELLSTYCCDAHKEIEKSEWEDLKITFKEMSRFALLALDAVEKGLQA